MQLLGISSKEAGSGYRLLLKGNGPLHSWLSLPMRKMETKRPEEGTGRTSKKNWDVELNNHHITQNVTANS